MASEVKLKLNVFLALYFISFLIAEINSQRLEIFPIQSVQKKPIGKSMMLTCRPSVPDTTLITDLKWNDNLNNTVMPKSFEKYIPLYDSKGQRLPEMTGRGTPPMYTEYLPGDQSLALMITSLTESMAGIYNCTASYANTDLLQIGVQIETFVAITWKDAPENQFPILRDDYKIRCEVTANPSPTVDWMRNGDQIKTGGRYVVETHGLLIRNVQESDDGVYTCRAAVIQTGELVERNIRVEVQIKPQVQPLDSTIDAVEGQSFSIICNSTGKPVPEFVWVKDSTQENVANSDRFFVNPQTGLLTISRVEPDDYSKYTCIAKNSAGISESKMLLNVLVRPKIYELLNITIEIKHQASIICKASGRPAPEITFRRYGEQEEYLVGPQPSDDRIILEQSYDEDRGESNATFIITKTMRSDDGLYECIARNKGDTAYKVGHITIEYPPSFEHMKGLPPVFSWEERKANLSCLAQGIPNATIEWWWNTKRIEELYDRNLEIVGKGPRSDLLITPTDRRYYTAYKCIAKNRIGTVEHMMELREARVPEPIIQVTVNVVTATTISFNIVGPPSEFGMPILAYSAQYKQDLTPDWGSASNRTWSPDSPYIIEGLKPHTPYQFRFCARNLVGQGSWGAHKQQSTPRRSAPEEPKTLHTLIQEGSKEDDPIVISPYADHFELRWNIPSDNGEPIDYFEIRYCSGYKVNDVWNSIEDSCVTKTVHVSETSYEMSNLQANSYYSIELLAHNAIGYSRSANLLLKTARGLDVIVHPENTVLSSSAIIAIAIGGILLLLLIVDLLCCIICNIGLSATICRRSKRSPSDFDDETKLGSLYGWRFPLPYCSTSVVKERPPSPLPLPPPVKFSGTPLTTPVEESQPLNSPNGSVMKNNSTVEFDGRVAHSRSGEIIGKNSAV